MTFEQWFFKSKNIGKYWKVLNRNLTDIFSNIFSNIFSIFIFLPAFSFSPFNSFSSPVFYFLQDLLIPTTCVQYLLIFETRLLSNSHIKHMFTLFTCIFF